MFPVSQKRKILDAAFRYKTAGDGLLPSAFEPVVAPVAQTVGGAYDLVKNTLAPAAQTISDVNKGITDMLLPIGAAATSLAGIRALLSKSYQRNGTSGVLDTILHGDRDSKMPMNAILPMALGAGVGFLLPPERQATESSGTYRKRKLKRVILGALLGGSGGLGYHILSNRKT